jgi:formate hydrogenlyase subunit 6/NADH:ubiquinone oxidoreductase subunit I
MERNLEIYAQFAEWLRHSWGHLPDSVELMPALMHAYTPQEAELLTGMPFEESSIEELADLKQMDPQDLASLLDALSSKGLFFRIRRGSAFKYRLVDGRFVLLRSFWWSGRDDEQTRAVAPHVNRYYLDGFGDNWKDVHTKGLRVLPIRQTIEDPRQLLPYEDALQVLQNEDRFAVATCACRHRKGLDPTQPRCKHETENCLHFGRYADYIVDNDLGRKIVREEAEEILTKSADAGLIHSVSNWQKELDTICNCCQCCCLYLEAFHVLKHSKPMNHSNYEVTINSKTCSGCGLCVKRCPMEALSLQESPDADNKSGKVAFLEPEGVCLGCGVCAHKCPTGSLTLRRRKQPDYPPIDVAQQRERFLAERKAAKSRK